jgi:membrane fusion protein (multidrug efflux system)
MKLKPQFIIGAVVIFWILFIGWGMIKTTFKLSGPKSPAQTERAKTDPQETKSEAETKTPTAGQNEPRLLLVRAFKAKAVNFQDSLPVMGTVKGKTEIELKFEINGIIKEIRFREGEKVKKGDAIASLDPKDSLLKVSYASNKFNSAQSSYKSVQKKLEVNQQLYAAGAIIKSKLEEVQLECESAGFQVETTKSEKELAENELKKTVIYATKDGLMGPREAEEGEFVTPQDKVGSILETVEVFVDVGVVERDIEKLKIGQKAKVFVDAYPNEVFEGTVEYIFPIIEGKSRTLTAKIKVPNPQGLLFPGMFSRAEISIVDLKNAVMVPITCLTTKGGLILAPAIPLTTIQKVADEEAQTGIVQMRKVTLGYKTSDYAEVKEGLNAGDLVVIEVQGEGEFKDNVKVKIVGTEEMNLSENTAGSS